MKKILICSFAVFALTSCEKEENIKTTGNSSTEANKIAPSPKLRVYYDFGYRYGCAGTGGNCLPTIIIWALTQQQQDTFSKLFKEDADINKIFINDKGTITEVIDADLVDSVISGHNFVEIKKDIESKTNYIVFKDNQDNLTGVYPIQL